MRIYLAAQFFFKFFPGAIVIAVAIIIWRREGEGEGKRGVSVGGDSA